MKWQRRFLIAFACLVSGFSTTILVAQQPQDDFSVEDLGASAKLVVTSVSGPTTTNHNQTISVTYRVKNNGTADSGSYTVGLYLSMDNNIDPASDRLLDKVTILTGLAPGASRKATAKILVPINGLSGSYYYGAVVGKSKKASSNRLSLNRYSLGEDNDTVTDHKTGLIWQRTDDGQQRNWLHANQYCGDLVLGGKSDWLLPRMDELGTIVDWTRYNPAIDPVFSCGSPHYWSSSTFILYPDTAWLVNTNDGYAGYADKTHCSYVLCVRGGAPTCTLPGAPTGVTATATEADAQAIVSFAPPASDGGSPVTSYTVTSSPGGITVTGASSPITVNGLTSEPAYTFTVVATNAVGTGPSSNPSNSVTPFFSASGRVTTSEGTGLSGVVMTFSKVSGSVTIPAPARTDSNGKWNQSGFSNGITFRVTPSKDGGYTFTPGSIDFSAAQNDLNFNYNGDMTVLINETGLMWQKSDDGVSRKWVDAGQYCLNLVMGGYADWRLPTLNEFETIVIRDHKPAIWGLFSCHSSGYWSSIVDSHDRDKAFYIDFGRGGGRYRDDKTWDRWVRCVRGGS